MSEFETTFAKYQRDMYLAARGVGASHVQAQDAVQDAAKTLGQMTTIRYFDVNKVRGLFCTIAKNKARDMMRHDKKSVPLNEETYSTSGVPENSPSGRDLNISISVHRALAKLNDMEGHIAWKYFGLQFSLREICEDLLKDKGLKWNYVTLHRFIRHTVRPKLKEALVEYGGDKL